MGIFYFYVFWPKHPLKLIFTHKKLSSAYFKYNLLYFLFSELFCRMKLNFWGSEIWPVMAWESSQAVVKPKAYILKNFAKWAQLLFRKSQESIITRDQPFVIYGGKTIGGGWISPPPYWLGLRHGESRVVKNVLLCWQHKNYIAPTLNIIYCIFCFLNFFVGWSWIFDVPGYGLWWPEKVARQ